MALIFEFTKTFELSLTASCVVLKVSACFPKNSNFSWLRRRKKNILLQKKGKLQKPCIE